MTRTPSLYLPVHSFICALTTSTADAQFRPRNPDSDAHSGIGWNPDTGRTRNPDFHDPGRIGIPDFPIPANLKSGFSGSNLKSSFRLSRRDSPDPGPIGLTLGTRIPKLESQDLPGACQPERPPCPRLRAFNFPAPRVVTVQVAEAHTKPAPRRPGRRKWHATPSGVATQ